MPSPKVAVLYPTYHTLASAVDIPDCFRSLEQVDYPREAWKMFCVENPSPHGASHPFIRADWLPRAGKTLPEIEILLNETDGGYAGVNVFGWQAAKAWGADYLYLLNQDASVDPEFLTRIVEEAECHPETAVFQSRVMLKQDPERLNSQGNALHFLGFGFSDGYKKTPTEAARTRLPLFYASGAAMLVRMKALEGIGLFESDYYMYHEDTDLSWRARLAGYDVRYVEDSVVYHRYEFSKSIRKFYWMERNRLLTHFARLKIPTLLLLLAPLFVMEFGTAFFAWKSGWLKEKARAWGFFLRPSTWKRIGQLRRQTTRLRRVPDHEILRHMVGRIEAQEIENPLLKRVVNPLMDVYFRLLKAIVRW